MVATNVLVLLSLLLLLTGSIVLRQLASRPLPKGGPVTELVLFGALDATLLIFGSVLSLAYVFTRRRPIWNAAVVLFQLALVPSSLLAVHGAAWFVSASATRGHFAELVNLVILIVAVIVPGLVTSGGLAALACLIAIRPEPQERVARWVKLQAAALAFLCIPAAFIIAFGVWNSPAARFQAQERRIKSGNASVEELAEALKSPNIDLRFWAVQELRKKGPGAKPAVPALAQALQDNAMISWPAADALAAIGPDAEPAIPALVEAIKREQGKRSGTGGDGPSTFAWLAGNALTKIGPPSIPELIALLAHEDRYVRMTAVHALGDMAPRAGDAVLPLQAALNDKDETVRQRARAALDRIESRPPMPQGGPALPPAANSMHKTSSAAWTTQAPYTGDPRNRPPGTVCITFDDGYRWLVTDSILTWDQWVEGERKFQAAISATLRYEHVLGTHEVRIINPIGGCPGCPTAD